MQYVPATLLEGGDIGLHTTPDPLHERKPGYYIRDDEALDREVALLHTLARIGRLPPDTADRHINMYLLVHHSTPPIPRLPRRWLRMPLTDAPHHSIMPDMGQVIHHILMREPIPCTLSHVIEQCIPRMRHAARAVQFNDSYDVLLMLVVGLLLGLYPGGVKKPGFNTRGVLFARLRALMTSVAEVKRAFCSRHEPVILLACMEYMARVLPAYMPAHYHAVTVADPTAAGFYKRIPPLTDDLRQWLDQGVAEEPDVDSVPSWQQIHEACAARVGRVTRLKRAPAPACVKSRQEPASSACARVLPLPSPHPFPETDALACWDVPLMAPHATNDDYRLLGAALGISGGLIRRIQQDVKVHPLPGNLRRLQLERLRERGRNQLRASYVQSRWSICMHCVTTQKPPPHTSPPPRLQMRLDTFTQELVCAGCMRRQIIHIDMLGRTLTYFNTSFYMCPTCFTVQPYSGGHEQPWGPGACCQHPSTTPPNPRTIKGGRVRNVCGVCGEKALAYSLSRVDHRTGAMQEFYYCQRHTPRHELARWCVNACQLAALDPRGPHQKRRY